MSVCAWKRGGVKHRDKAVLQYDIFRLPLRGSATVLPIINCYPNLAQRLLSDAIKTNQVWQEVSLITLLTTCSMAFLSLTHWGTEHTPTSPVQQTCNALASKPVLLIYNANTLNKKTRQGKTLINAVLVSCCKPDLKLDWWKYFQRYQLVI